MSLTDRVDHTVYIFGTLDLHELTAVFLHSRESVEILDEMLASLHHPMSSLHLPEEITMFYHRREDLIECGYIVPREKTPRVTETRSSYHKTIEILESSRMHHLGDPIFITHHIAIADHGDADMLFEFIDPSQISTSSKSLLIGSPMHRDEIGSCIFQSLHEVYEEIRIFPSESSFH
jgi:hypothetical protein